MRVATLLILSLGFSACTSVPADWHPHIYEGNPATASVIRAQDKESISCSDPKFHEMKCFNDDDLMKLALKWSCQQ